MHQHAGFSGSAHDSRVFMKSHIWLHHAYFFKSPKYILIDIGYPLSAITLPPYKIGEFDGFLPLHWANIRHSFQVIKEQP